MKEMRALKRVGISGAVLLGAILAIGASTDLQPQPARAPTSGGNYSHEVLQGDAEMTQRMSTPTADGRMQRGETRDAQLDRSQNPGFLADLEQHQADIDRMLARPTP